MSKISNSLSFFTWICALLLLGGIISGSKAESVSFTDNNNRSNTSSIALNPITISNGQILSRALLLDPSLLLPLKQQIQNNAISDPVLQNSLEQLITQANSFVSLRPTSVVEKDELPASGDKHDFLSLAPYRWPDPDKPNGLPYINIDGRLNPEVYLVPDKRNMDDMVYRVKILSLAYYFTDNLNYSSKAAELLRVWFLNNSTHMNPNLQYAEMVRGESNGTMRGILHGKYLPEVLDAIRLIQHSASWSKEDQQGVERWFTEYLNWLIYSPHGKEERRQPNNHGTWYRVQALTIALALNKTDIAKSLIQNVWNDLIYRQIDADGSLKYEISRKNALDYSTFNVLGLFRLATLGEKFGIDLWNQKTHEGAGLQKAFDYLLPSLLGKETWPHSQIKLIDRKNIMDLLCRAAVHYQNNQAYIEACDTASTKRIDPALSHPP
jgi:Alginate lyase